AEPLRGRGLRSGARGRGAWGQRPRPVWPAIGEARGDMPAADKAQARMIEIVAVKIVDDRAEGAGRHERIALLVLEEDGDAGTRVLIAVVLPDHAFAGCRIVWRADAGIEHQQRIVEDIGAKDHETGWLLV